MFKIAQALVSKINEASNILSKQRGPIVAPNNFSNYMSKLPSLTKIDANTPFANVDKDMFARAQARMEGYFNKGKTQNIGQLNFNPGNIRFGAFAQKMGGTLGKNGFARFANEEQGFAAMKALYDTPGYKNQTVGGVINRWAPPIENNTNAYINNVVNWYNGGNI